MENIMNFKLTKKGIISLIISILTAICGVILGFNFIGNGLDGDTANIIIVIAGAINAVLAFLMGKNEKNLDNKVQTLLSKKK